MSDKPIYVTQPSLPPLEEFIPYLEKIWDSKVLTNGGAMHQQLEVELAAYLGVNEIALCSNGTIALILAIRALNLTGEVITTPYSFVATTHSLLWNGLTPVFVDIDPDTQNLDPAKIEAVITDKTSAIMPVHCYGTPCDVNAIDAIAKKHKLKVIYDAAHAFGVRNGRGGSLLNHGDLSVLSFHATKVFSTLEGGAIICPDKETKQHINYLKNFGFASETRIVETGINGKMNEVQAAFGLLQLKRLNEALGRRKIIDQIYRSELSSIKGLRCIKNDDQVESNYSYFPVLVEESFKVSRDALYEYLKSRNIFSRRYFFPLITDFPMYRNLPSAAPSNLPVARRIADQVLCLPLAATMQPDDAYRVISAIKEVSI